MKEDEAYLEVANRYIDSCQEHLANSINIQEVIGFKCYHAFESIAGAFNSHFGKTVPRRHDSKLNLFVTSARHNHLVNGQAIAQHAIVLNSMRNRYLYPEKIGDSFITPKEQISLTHARSLVRSVRGIVKQVAKII